MEVKESGYKNSKVEFFREFPPGCRASSSNLMGFFKVKKFEDYLRDWPSGCGPNASKSIKSLLESEKNGKFDGDFNTWRRNVSAVKSRPQLGSDHDEILLRNPQKSNKFREGKVGPREDSSVLRNPQKNYFREGNVGPREGFSELRNPQKNNFREGKVGSREGFSELRNPQKSNFREGKVGPREGFSELRKPQKGVVVKGGATSATIAGARDEVVEMLRVFRNRCNEISMSGKGIKRVDTTAYGELRGEGKIVNRSAMIIGSVPGVEIGDKFYYRLELVFVGLHKLTQGGIDTMDLGGVRFTTCVVANERHLDKMSDPNVLVYIGEGGNLKRHEIGVPPDQELKGGNRALYNSMERKKPVRVVRGLMSERSSNAKTLYVYDGLYDVMNCQQKKGPLGNMIFEFRLIRRSDQPPVPWQECRRSLF